MSRSFGAMSLTTRSAMRISPPLASSSPATIRSAVDLPDPDGPTSTVNPPSGMSRSSSSTARVPSGNTFETPENAMLAMGTPDEVAVPEARPLGHPPLRRVVHVHQSEALRVAVLPLEVVEHRPREVAPDVDAVGDRPRERADVRAQVLDPARVLQRPVHHRPVLERGAVLGDVDRHVAVVAPHAHEQLVQAAG